MRRCDKYDRYFKFVKVTDCHCDKDAEIAGLVSTD